MSLLRIRRRIVPKLFGHRYFGILVLILAAVIPLQEAGACPACAADSRQTLADSLLGYDDIVFAGTDPGSSFSLVPVETLRGPETSEGIEMFFDSATELRLKSSPGSVIVLARMTGRTWQYIAFADEEYRDFIRNVVSYRDRWLAPYGNIERVRFFSRNLTSSHPLIWKDAYSEVARAPYSRIKDLAPNVPKEDIYSILDNDQSGKWHALYALMLGQSEDPRARSYIGDRVETIQRAGSATNLSAWLIALIETREEAGVEMIEELYFANSKRSSDEIAQALMCMSIIGDELASAETAQPALADRIVESYGVLLEYHPMKAGYVAMDLTRWDVRAHIEKLSQIRESSAGMNSTDTYLVDSYLSSYGR